MQTQHSTPESIWAELPQTVKSEIRKKHFRIYGLDATAIAKNVARSPDLINRMQGIVLLGVFLRVTPLAQERGFDQEHLLGAMQEIVRKYFGKRGEKALEDNMTCIRKGYCDVIEVSPQLQECTQNV